MPSRYGFNSYLAHNFAQRPGALQTSTFQVYDYIAKEWSSVCDGGGE